MFVFQSSHGKKYLITVVFVADFTDLCTETRANGIVGMCGRDRERMIEYLEGYNEGETKKKFTLEPLG